MNYSDVYLIPRYSPLESRQEADITARFLGRDFKVPWMPANMESVIDIKTAKWLSENDYFYIMHRFHDTYHFVQKTNEEKWKTISISIGVKDEDMILLGLIAAKYLRVDYITIDIAHGHCTRMNEMLDYIKGIEFNTWDFQSVENEEGSIGEVGFKLKKYRPKIIAGNVATRDAVLDLQKWGADAVKVGIAGGGACSTKHQTGFHVPMFTCVKNCTELLPFPQIPVIADGGVRENGDIAKALAAGASMVMAGGLFAACTDAPGEDIYDGVILYTKSICDSDYKPVKKIAKRYYGSASARQKGHNKHVEGLVTDIPINGMTFAEKYEEMTDALKSAVSYSGGRDLLNFKYLQYAEKH